MDEHKTKRIQADIHIHIVHKIIRATVLLNANTPNGKTMEIMFNFRNKVTINS